VIIASAQVEVAGHDGRVLARATVYHATGRPIRDLPITAAKLLA